MFVIFLHKKLKTHITSRFFSHNICKLSLFFCYEYHITYKITTTLELREIWHNIILTVYLIIFFPQCSLVNNWKIKNKCNVFLRRFRNLHLTYRLKPVFHFKIKNEACSTQFFYNNYPKKQTLWWNFPGCENAK